ncbi:MAG TPA: ComF family protein [Opitutaceae bacterium]|nr:ComF family protein [Opitutaceae bacterium]
MTASGPPRDLGGYARAGARWGKALRDVLFPPVCVHCARLVEDSRYEHLCAVCAARIDLVAQPHCDTCGYPFAGVMAGERTCPHCEELVPVFRAGKTAALYRGPMASLVQRLKYHRGEYLGADIARIAAAAPGFRDFLRGATLVPVPLHHRKERERGFNQTRLIAEAFARAAEGAGVVPALQRIVDTQTQTRLDRDARRDNLKNAFAMAPGRSLTPGARIVLVDDIFTTGATLNACASVLRKAGFDNLDVATLAHG